MRNRDLDLTADIIDVRDIIARFEELEELIEDQPDEIDDDNEAEHAALSAILEELSGNGGDEQWRGGWYPVTLIRESYFKDYAMELAEEIGAIDRNASWPLRCIDWDKAAWELRMDYTSADIDGTTYWYR